MRKVIDSLFASLLLVVLASANVLAQSTQMGAALKKIVFLGDSLSAGLGVEHPEAFPALIGEKVRAAGLPFEVENAGLSGDTSAGGLRRIDWVLQQNVDVLVLELGGNDGLRGLPVKELRANLEAIVAKVKAKNPAVKVVLVGMQMPPNLGGGYAAEFQRAYAEVAKESGATLLPFLLEGVGGHRELNQPDMIHPTAAGHRLIAETVWRTLEPILRQG